MKEFFKDEIASVYLDTKTNVLYLEYYKKVPSHAEFLRINTALLDAFKSIHSQIVVADVRKMGILSLESQAWVPEVLLPGMIAHLKGKTFYHAQFLDPSEIFAKVSAQNVKNKAEKNIPNFELKQFSTKSELDKCIADWNALIVPVK